MMSDIHARNRHETRNQFRDEPNDYGCGDCGGAIEVEPTEDGAVITCENCGVIHSGGF